MTPSEHQFTPVEPAIEPKSAAWPFWGYLDLLLFASLIFPSLIVAALLIRLISLGVKIEAPIQEMLVQLISYAFIFSALRALLRLRYDQPFWRSLRWNFRWRDAALTFVAGPLLAFTLGYLGYILRAPYIQSPFDQMLRDRPTLLLFAVFAVVIGPLCEELAFRGFLMPLLIRSLGPAAGIVITSLLFGALHAPQYSWSWKHALLVALAGLVFGWTRYRTNSTASGAFMHFGFNLTQLVFSIAQA
jgi:membrane protease YdiL (CAAX protease family)